MSSHSLFALYFYYMNWSQREREQQIGKTNLSKFAAKLQIFCALNFIRRGWLLLIMVAVTHLMCQLENVHICMYVECRCKWIQYIFVRFYIVVRGRRVPNECIDIHNFCFLWVIIKCFPVFGCVRVGVCSQHLFFALSLISFFISTLNCGPTAAVQFAIISQQCYLQWAQHELTMNKTT